MLSEGRAGEAICTLLDQYFFSCLLACCGALPRWPCMPQHGPLLVVARLPSQKKAPPPHGLGTSAASPSRVRLAGQLVAAAPSRLQGPPRMLHFTRNASVSEWQAKHTKKLLPSSAIRATESFERIIWLVLAGGRFLQGETSTTHTLG